MGMTQLRGIFERRVRVLGSEALALIDDSLSDIAVRFRFTVS
jgi:hypothetical protein